MAYGTSSPVVHGYSSMLPQSGAPVEAHSCGMHWAFMSAWIARLFGEPMMPDRIVTWSSKTSSSTLALVRSAVYWSSLTISSISVPSMPPFSAL